MSVFRQSKKKETRVTIRRLKPLVNFLVLMIEKSDIIILIISVSLLIIGLSRWYTQMHPDFTFWSADKIISAFSRSSSEEESEDFSANASVTTMFAETGSPTLNNTDLQRPLSTRTAPVSQPAIVKAPASTGSVQPKSGSQNLKTNTTILVLSARGKNKSVNVAPTGLAQEEFAQQIANREIQNSGTGAVQNSYAASVTNSAATTVRIHDVVAGENLTVIARQVGSTVAQLKALNGLSGDRIQVGQKLIY